MSSFEIAHVTMIRFQASMVLFMMIQFALELESLVTLIALERPFISMIANNVRL